MARGLSGVVMRGFGARDHTATVIETDYLTPNFVRITMVSPTLFEDAVAEPTSWLRFWFPDPDGTDAEFQRAYTITGAEVGTGHFASPGPATVARSTATARSGGRSDW